MPHWIAQPTLFELTACDKFEPPRGLAAGHTSQSVTPKSGRSTLEGYVSPTDARGTGRCPRGQVCHSMRCERPVGGGSAELAFSGWPGVWA
jgi:hypothetical protein